MLVLKVHKLPGGPVTVDPNRRPHPLRGLRALIEGLPPRHPQAIYALSGRA
jgi:hypothetical protein